MRFKLLLFFIFFSICRMAFAEVVVETSVDPAMGTRNDSYLLKVIISGDFSKISRPEFNNSSEFELNFSGSSSSTEIINFEKTEEVTFSYLVGVSGNLKVGKYHLPSGKINVNGEVKEFVGPEINIIEDNSSKSKSSDNKSANKMGVDFTQIVDNDEPYVGEQVVYRAEIASNKSIANASLDDLSLNGFWRESFGKKAEQKRNVGNILVFSLLDGIFPNKEGEQEIPPRKFKANVEIIETAGPQRSWNLFDRFFDDMDVFASRKLVPLELLAPGLKIKVKPLPNPPKNNLSYIPVGKVQVNSSVESQTVKQGESLTLTIEISGDANLRPYDLSLPQGKDLDNFKIYIDQPKIEVIPRDNKLFFKKTWKLALVCQKAGKFQLPQYEVITFDPQSKQYRAETTLTKEIEVLPDSTNNNLIVYGEPKEEKTKTNQADNRQAIQILSEDLRPQHVSDGLYLPRYKFSNLFFFLLCLIPLFTFFISYLHNKKIKNLNNPNKILSKKALSKAVSSLSEKNINPELLTSIFKIYLGEKFAVAAESMTASEVRILLVEKLKNQALAPKAEELLGKLQKYLYAGLRIEDSQMRGLVEQTKNLIMEIEKNV